MPPKSKPKPESEPKPYEKRIENSIENRKAKRHEKINANRMKMWVEIDEDDDYKHGTSKQAYNIKINNNNSGMFQIFYSEYNDGELMIVNFINGRFDDIYSELKNYYIVGNDITVEIKYVSAEIHGVKQQYTLSNFLTTFEDKIADYGSVYYLVEKGVCGDDFVAKSDDEYMDSEDEHIQMFKEMYDVFERVVDKGWFNIDMKPDNMCKVNGKYKMIDFDSRLFIHTDPNIPKKSYIDYMLFRIYLNLKQQNKIRIPIIISRDDFNLMIDNISRYVHPLDKIIQADLVFDQCIIDVNNTRLTTLTELYRKYFVGFKISKINNSGNTEIYKPGNGSVGRDSYATCLELIDPFFNSGHEYTVRDNNNNTISYNNYISILHQKGFNTYNIYNVVRQILQCHYQTTQEYISNNNILDSNNISIRLHISVGQVRRAFAQNFIIALLTELFEDHYLQIKSYIMSVIKPKFNENSSNLIDQYKNRFIDIISNKTPISPILNLAKIPKKYVTNFDYDEENNQKLKVALLSLVGNEFSPITFREAHAPAFAPAFAPRQAQAFAPRQAQAFAQAPAFAPAFAPRQAQAFAQTPPAAPAPGWSVFGFNPFNWGGGKKTKRKKRSRKNRSRRF
jgi:hypothetical protein